MLSKSLTAVALLGSPSVVTAFWRMECRGQTGLGRLDPIVDYGVASSHSHTIQGSSGFSLTADYSDLVGGDCTSCAVKQDKSAYWTPNVYFLEDGADEFVPVPQVGGMLAYYLPRGNNVTAFPPGFQVVAGDTNRRNFTVGDPYSPDPPQSSWAALKQTGQSDLAQRAVGFNCLNYKAPAEPSLYRHYMPNKTWTDENCPDGLRFELMFPSCWNGETTAPDHKSHVAYPDLVGNGDCPSDYPLRLVTLFYETIWDTRSELFQGKSGSFVISNGDRTGFGYHGDFIMGWDESFLQEAIETCTNGSGELTDCPTFMNNGPLQSEAQQNECKFPMPSVLDTEDCSKTMKLLPGNVQIQDGPEPAVPGGGGGSYPIFSSILGGLIPPSPSTTPAAPTTTSTPTSTSTPASSSSSSISSGGAFLENPSPAATSSSGGVTALDVPPAPSPATTSAPSSMPGVDYTIVSTQTVTASTGMVEEIVWEAPVVYVTEDFVTTVTVSSQKKREARRQGHALRHRHNHQHGF